MIREIEKSPQENISLSSNPIHRDKFFPSQFADPNIRLLKVRAHGKEAVEPGWQTVANYGVNSPVIREWIKHGNYGVTSPAGFYASVDADTKEIQDALDGPHPCCGSCSTPVCCTPRVVTQGCLYSYILNICIPDISSEVFYQYHLTGNRISASRKY